MWWEWLSLLMELWTHCCISGYLSRSELYLTCQSHHWSLFEVPCSTQLKHRQATHQSGRCKSSVCGCSQTYQCCICWLPTWSCYKARLQLYILEDLTAPPTCFEARDVMDSSSQKTSLYVTSRLRESLNLSMKQIEFGSTKRARWHLRRSWPWPHHSGPH